MDAGFSVDINAMRFQKRRSRTISGNAGVGKGSVIDLPCTAGGAARGLPEGEAAGSRQMAVGRGS